MFLMGIFKKFRKLDIPEECKGMSVRIESSVCTGEKTIGFYNPDTRKLMYTELVRSDADIQAFYDKYDVN